MCIQPNPDFEAEYWQVIDHEALKQRVLREVRRCKGYIRPGQPVVIVADGDVLVVRRPTSALPMPADFALALEDIAEHGIRYVRPGIDWAAIENEDWRD